MSTTYWSTPFPRLMLMFSASHRKAACTPRTHGSVWPQQTPCMSPPNAHSETTCEQQISQSFTLSLGLELFLLSTISTMQLSPSKSPPLALYSSVFLLLPVPCGFVFPHRQATEAEYQRTMAGFLLVNLSNHFNKKHSWVRREEQGRETQPEAE